MHVIPTRSNYMRPKCRRGLSILEVLVSIGILVLGLLGVVALIPIAAQNINRGIALDDSTAVARGGVADFQARSANNLQKWLRYPVGGPPIVPAGGQMSGLLGVQMADPTITSTYVNPTWAFCIDPLMYEKILVNDGGDRQLSFFPYQPRTPGSPDFPDLTAVNGGAGSMTRGRMLRVALNWRALDWRARAGNAFVALNVGLAESMCVTSDDLLLTAPGQEPQTGGFGITVGQTEAPASQQDANQLLSWDDPSTTRVKRNATGRLSWFATMTPLAGSVAGGARYYTLSVAVVERRDVVIDAGRETTIDSTEESLQEVEGERTAGIRFVGGGLNGGEVELVSYQTDPALALKSLSRMREGNWILVSGPIMPTPTNPNPVGHIFNWYRIGSIEPQPSIQGAEVVRTATLRGPDWPTGVTYVPGPVAVGEAIIVNNVINVFEQTIELRGE
jgi:hypothetical protein